MRFKPIERILHFFPCFVVSLLLFSMGIELLRLPKKDLLLDRAQKRNGNL